jgi:hypothetical protein
MREFDANMLDVWVMVAHHLREAPENFAVLTADVAVVICECIDLVVSADRAEAITPRYSIEYREIPRHRRLLFAF